MQVDVFAYEYSGYGHATGKPCEENLYSVRYSGDIGEIIEEI